jgi:nucleoside-diphosphate-sugar epimerase
MNLNGKDVVVTGGSGFLGSFLCEIINSKTSANLIVPRSNDYDLTEEEDIQKLYQDFEPSLVIHLAAVVGGIGLNQRKPGQFFYDNLVMGANLLEYGRRAGIEKFVALGTICAYPKDTEVPFKEEDLWEGYPEETNAPYGMAKKMMLVQSRAYREEYNFNSIFLLPVNLYGPRDDFDLQDSHVIPAMIRKFNEAKRQDQESVTLWGTGEPTREFLYVKDAAEGIFKATRRYDRSEPVNLGANFEISIRDLAEKIKSMVEYNGEIEWDTSKPDGQPRRCLDTTRAKECFGFEAGTNFDQGLRKTVEWYRNNRSRVLENPSKTGFQRDVEFPSWIQTKP